MHLASVTQSEIRGTLEVMIDLTNAVVASDLDARNLLVEASFSGAAEASEAALRRLETRLVGLAPLILDLPDTDVATLAPRLNRELSSLPITPSITDHDEIGPHLHWTPGSATFDDQVMSDLLMALAQEVCDNGTIRFGRCDADNCDELFYDATRNRSRRFCSDPRCASRTHTADHRARQKR